jgi:hypothetical protein
MLHHKAEQQHTTVSHALARKLDAIASAEAPELPPPYYVDEEEVPSAGTQVRRAYQRTRWYGGRTYVWIGRYRETGRGLGSSSLRFDQIEPVQTSA